MRKLLRNLGEIAHVSGLDEKERTQRSLLVYQGALMSLGGIVWGTICFAFGLYLPSLIPLGYTVLTILNFSVLAYSKSFAVSRFFQVLISLLLPFAFQALLGGYHVTGAVSLWALLSLVSSITFQSIRSALIWTGFYLSLIVALGVLDGGFTRRIPPEFAPLLFTINIAVISAMVVALIIYFVWSRDRANEELLIARRETETILHEVQEGLLLLDVEGKIAAGFSDSARQLLGIEDLAGRDFPELMAALTEIKRETTADYLDLVFAGRLSVKKTAFLNPLARIRYGVGTAAERYLSFVFRPIRDDSNAVRRIFVTIVDVSEEVKLELEIKLQREKSQKRIELISQILNSRPALIRSFLDDTSSELSALDLFLNASEQERDFKAVLNTIYRAVHAIKGNAALIKLEYFVRICHRLEESLDELLQRPALTGLDLLEPVGELDNLKQAGRDLRVQFENLQSFATVESFDSERDLLQENLADLANSVGKAEGKEVTLSLEGSLNPERFSLKTIRTILVQLVRNAVTHGIEPPTEREQAGKPRAGAIRIQLTPDDPRLVIRFEDDGAGIDLQRVREKIRSADEDPDAMSEQQVLQSLFRPGLSTRARADENAGRGIGLDILKAEVKRSGGSVKLRNRPGNGAVFIVALSPMDAQIGRTA